MPSRSVERGVAIYARTKCQLSHLGPCYNVIDTILFNASLTRATFTFRPDRFRRNHESQLSQSNRHSDSHFGNHRGWVRVKENRICPGKIDMHGSLCRWRSAGGKQMQSASDFALHIQHIKFLHWWCLRAFQHSISCRHIQKLYAR